MMTTMTRQLGLAASLVFVSNCAYANAYDLDTFGGPSGLFNATFNTGLASAFTDTFSFTAPETAPFSWSLVPAWNFSVNFQSTLAEVQEFTSVTLNDITGTVWNHDVFAFAQIDSTNAINYRSIAPGQYTISLSGIALDHFATYDLAISLSPIPEPNSIVLMLGGLGLIGYMASRHRKGA